MITRKSAFLIAEAYDYCFKKKGTSSSYQLIRDSLYDFLYRNDYEAWFLNCIKSMREYDRPRQLKEFIMCLHTGESFIKVTPKWDQNERKKLGQNYLKNLAQDILIYLTGYFFYKSDERERKVNFLKRQLELDGYIFEDKNLLETESSVIDEKEEQEYLLYLVEQAKLEDLEVIKHTLKLSEEHYLNGKWDDSISNSRRYLEAILLQIASSLSKHKYQKDLNTKILESASQVRQYLQKEELIEKKETDALAKIYGLLSNTGSHPYIAEKDQARLLRHLSLTMSQFVLLRFIGFIG